MKIFQTKSGHLSELKESLEGGKYFVFEKTIQGLVENNLSEIFNDLEFVKSEHQIEDLRPDTIAFDKERQSFAIIEYKNKKNESLVEQGISYYQLLQEKKGEFVLLYNKLKNKKFDVDDINWDDTRIIFISPKFSKYQQKASGFQGLPTELYEIKKYENDVITLDRVDIHGEVSSTENKKTRTHVRTPITLTEYSEEDYLAGKYTSRMKSLVSPQSKKIWIDIKNKILDAFDKLEFKQKKKYGGFYSKEDNSCICTLDATKSAIWLSYSTTMKNFFLNSNFASYTTKGHFGVGHYGSKIKTDKDIETSLPLIQKVYELKIKI